MTLKDKRYYESWQRWCSIQVTRHVQDGLIIPARALQCVDCDGPAQHYDHRDYTDPFQIEPVCKGCNKKRGKAAFPSRMAPRLPKRGNIRLPYVKRQNSAQITPPAGIEAWVAAKLA